MKLLVVFHGRSAESKDVVYVCKREIQVSEDLNHETLEGLGGVTLAKGHEEKFKKAEICGDCCLLYVFRVDRVSLNHLNLRKGGAAGKAVGVVLYV